jgi:acetate kinase
LKYVLLEEFGSTRNKSYIIPVTNQTVKMSSVTEEIQQLQLRILELEKQKKEKDENEKKTSMDHNFNVINVLLNEKKNAINNNRYSKSVPLARYYDQELVTHLEAIYNILQIVDERLKKLEEI